MLTEIFETNFRALSVPFDFVQVFPEILVAKNAPLKSVSSQSAFQLSVWFIESRYRPLGMPAYNMETSVTSIASFKVCPSAVMESSVRKKDGFKQISSANPHGSNAIPYKSINAQNVIVF